MLRTQYCKIFLVMIIIGGVYLIHGVKYAPTPLNNLNTFLSNLDKGKDTDLDYVKTAFKENIYDWMMNDDIDEWIENEDNFKTIKTALHKIPKKNLNNAIIDGLKFLLTDKKSPDAALYLRKFLDKMDLKMLINEQKEDYEFIFNENSDWYKKNPEVLTYTFNDIKKLKGKTLKDFFQSNKERSEDQNSINNFAAALNSLVKG